MYNMFKNKEKIKELSKKINNLSFFVHTKSTQKQKSKCPKPNDQIRKANNIYKSQYVKYDSVSDKVEKKNSIKTLKDNNSR